MFPYYYIRIKNGKKLKQLVIKPPNTLIIYFFLMGTSFILYCGTLQGQMGLGWHWREDAGEHQVLESET